MRKHIVVLAGVALLALAPSLASSQESEPPLMKQVWSFDGPFGTIDRAAAQRGLEVYEEVCSKCHSMNLLHYGDLTALGYTEEQVKAIASQHQVTDGPNDQGEMFQRPGRPADKFVAPFPNEKAARAALNGALPPDLSLIIKAREGGPDYAYSILNGYKNPPAGVKMADGMQYNEFFTTGNHQIAMPPPLAGDDVKFADGAKSTLPDEARDVVTFLTWAAEPTQEDRKRTGAKVIIFLLVMTGFLYAAKRKIWADVH
jgi:ubiquinol-cytochrome c reductase cytochrome c1 subunit